jgi:hypothetical protein
MQATVANTQLIPAELERVTEESLEQAAQLRELTSLELSLVGGGTCAVVFA